MRSYLDFEKPVAELEAKLEELRALGESHDAVAISDDIARLEAKAGAALKELYGTLSPWQKTLVARHPERPHFVEYCKTLIADFTPLAGDRSFGEDEAIVGGFGRFRGEPVCVIRRRATPPKSASATTSAWRARRAIAKPPGSWNWPTASRCRS
jgi:acetyl-CoA carboxylase carboxyl transferase subunit alpha